MSTLNNVELLIITIILSLFFLCSLALVVELLMAIVKIRRIASKAEALINDVESAAQAVKHLSEASTQRFPLISLIYKLFQISSDKRAK